LASRYAIAKILPPSKMQDAIDRGHHCANGIAGYCGVTVEFAENAIKYYRRKQEVFWQE